MQFVQLSGGLDGGSEPPAFQRAERERLLAKEAACTNCTILSDENNNKDLNVIMIFSLFFFFATF